MPGMAAGGMEGGMAARPSGGAPALHHVRTALLRLAAFLGIALFTFLAGGFAMFSTHVSHMATPRDPPPADAIIVLTGGQARIDAAVNLLRDGKGERLLISGVHPAAGLAALSRATGGNANLFSCCVDIDHDALDTVGNAEQSAKWLESHAYRSVILVTNNYHMPRSLLEMKRLVGAEATVTPYPVVNTPLDSGRWMLRSDALRVLATEYAKYLASLARGMLPDMAPQPVAQTAPQTAAVAASQTVER